MFAPASRPSQPSVKTEPTPSSAPSAKPPSSQPAPLKDNQQEWERRFKGEANGLQFNLRIQRTANGHLHARYQVNPGKGEGWHLEGQLREDNTFALKGTDNNALFEGYLSPSGLGITASFSNNDFRVEKLLLTLERRTVTLVPAKPGGTQAVPGTQATGGQAAQAGSSGQQSSRDQEGKPWDKTISAQQRLRKKALQEAGFLEGLAVLASKYNVPADNLLALFNLESSLDPQANRDKSAQYKGLMQIGDAALEDINHLIKLRKLTLKRLASTRELASLSALEQMPYIDLYLGSHIGNVADRERAAGRQMSLEHLYMAVLGGNAGLADQAVWAVRGSANYTSNPMDANNDGQVTPQETADTIRGKWAAEFGNNLDERSRHIRWIKRDGQGYYLFDPKYDNGLPMNADPTRAAPAGGGNGAVAQAPSSPAPVQATAPTPNSNSGTGPVSHLDQLMGFTQPVPTYSVDEIQQAHQLINSQPVGERAALNLDLQRKVAYRNQRNNATLDDGESAGDDMCNVTSLAMVLETAGIGKPKTLAEQNQRFQRPPVLTDQQLADMQFEDYIDLIRRHYKLGQRTSKDTLAKLAAVFGADWQWLPSGTIGSKQRWIRILEPELTAGRGVIMSVWGHIVRVEGWDKTGLLVDDPYGNITLRNGYDSGLYSWAAINRRDSSKVPGKNQVWPWEEVTKHGMLWMASVGK